MLRKTLREFGTDQCTDLAAALTYYAVLSLFPALVVVVSLLGVLGQGQRTTETVLQIIGDLGPSSAVETLRGPIQQLVESPSAGFALVLGHRRGDVVGVWIHRRLRPGDEPDL